MLALALDTATGSASAALVRDGDVLGMRPTTAATVLEAFEELLYEDEGLTSERKRVKQLLDAYRDAFNTLSEVTFKPSSAQSG